MSNKQSKKCPFCGRRVFDVTKLKKEEIQIEMKCPKCKNLIKIPC